MKRATAILFAVLVVVVLAAIAASAKGILPAMVYRHGLTNEQIDGILARHPDAQLRITAQDWRAMKYQLFRFDCMTNYVNLIGSTQDCARVLLAAHDRAEELASSNATLRSAVRLGKQQAEAAAERAREYADAYAAATNNLQAALADYTSASNRAARAEARHDAVVDWCEQQRDKALLPSTKAIWQAIIDRMEGE